MKTIHVIASVLTALVLLLSRAAQASPFSTASTEYALRLSTALACEERAIESKCKVLQVSREELNHDVVYYRALIKVGPSDFDVIAANRIVRESRWHPLRTSGSFFFVHGSSVDFRNTLVNPHRDGLGVFLAEHNIDVWGIDLRNVQIPAATKDLSFGREWGFDVQIRDVMLATRIARHVRALTLCDRGAIILGGHSSGASLVFAVANAEAVLPESKRDVAGIVPIDTVYKLPASAASQVKWACDFEAAFRSFIATGSFFFDNASGIAMAKLAQTDPNGVSPYGPPLTNLQYALQAAGQLGFWPQFPFHAFAVIRDSAGIAIDGRYTSIPDILESFATVPPFSWPNAMGADYFSTSCGREDTPYDDNLGQIRIPVLYIAAAGGMGPLGEYTTQLLGSSDITKIMIQLQPEANATEDFGHVDPFTAGIARRLVWEPIRAWIVSRSH